MLKHATLTRVPSTLKKLKNHNDNNLSTQTGALCQDGIVGHQSYDEIDASSPIPTTTAVTQMCINDKLSFSSRDCIETASLNASSPLPSTNLHAHSPSILSTPSKLRPHHSSSSFSSSSALTRLKSSFRSTCSTSTIQTNSNLSITSTPTNQKTTSASDSMIKIFAQTLSQDVEYITLHVNSQTKSQQIIKSLLRKFRLKHRDPNLFYLTLERWIRKDGIKFKSVMVLGDEACPLQLQQCCSNPPHNDIKFTLQMKAGALVKIHCSDVVPDARYKCLSLSTETTVEETIELILHCLNLGNPSSNNNSNGNNHTIQNQQPPRATNSPSSTGSIGSSGSNSDSSSSGIDSDSNPFACQATATSSPQPPSSISTKTTTTTSNHHQAISFANIHINHHLDVSTTTNGSSNSNMHSRTSSLSSISSGSQSSTIVSALADQYCLVIECRDTSYKRVLDSDEYLVDVYQGLIAESRGQLASPGFISNSQFKRPTAVVGGNQEMSAPNSSTQNGSPPNLFEVSSISSPEQWFIISLKRRDDLISVTFANGSSSAGNCSLTKHIMPATIGFTNPRQYQPLPAIPQSLTQQFVDNHLKHMVTTTQIEVPNSSGAPVRIIRPQPPLPLASVTESSRTNNVRALTDNNKVVSTPAGDVSLNQLESLRTVLANSDIGRREQQPSTRAPPPPQFICIGPPMVQPRRRNLINATSTFGRPMVSDNRRRYNPAQLADDLSKLDVGRATIDG